MGFIYKITSPSGKVYVGQTTCANRRKSDYKTLRHRSKHSIIISSIKKYGWDNHIFEIIEDVENSFLNEREIFWIEKLKTFYPENENGMNLTRGGGGVSQKWKHDVERVKKAKLRIGEKSPNFGKVLSKEIKDKISNSVRKYNIQNNKKPLPQCYEALVKMKSKAVLCYDISGNFFNEFNSIKNAAIELGLSRKTVNDAVNGRQYHAGGYFFRPKTDCFSDKIFIDYDKVCLRNRKILCFFNEELICEASSLKEMSDLIGLKFGTIKDAFFDNRQTRNGYRFVYKDLHLEEYKLVS